MGQHADDILDGFVDQFTGEYIDGDAPGYPRSWKEPMIRHADGRITKRDHDPKHFTKGTRAIRKELAILINTRKAEIPNITQKQVNNLVEECRREINTKYGKGWREQY